MQNQPEQKANPSGGEQGILDAAEILFAQKGFDAVVADPLDASGVVETIERALAIVY